MSLFDRFRTHAICRHLSVLLYKWLPRANVMEFLNHGNTQVTEFEKNGGVVVTKIGKRKFINRESLAKLLNDNTIKDEVL